MSYAFDHKALSFDESSYEISQFYPVEGESAKVASGNKFEITLQPFEMRLYNIKSVSKI